MTNHNSLFASKYMQDSAIAGDIRTIKSISTYIFDTSKTRFFSWLFRPNEIETAEYVYRVVDYSGDNCYFQIAVSHLKDWFNGVNDEDEDYFQMKCLYHYDIENLIKFCEENEIDYIIESK